MDSDGFVWWKLIVIGVIVMVLTALIEVLMRRYRENKKKK